MVAVTLSSWRVLSRPDCSLCDDMLAELVALLGERAAAIQVQDISGDVELERRYGARIPVLLIDDEFICAWRLDPSRLSAWLAR